MGQGGFVKLLQQFPNRYKFHENQEEMMREFLQKDVSILTKTINNDRVPYTMKQLRLDYESKPKQRHLFDLNDIGGCGCFIDE